MIVFPENIKHMPENTAIAANKKENNHKGQQETQISQHRGTSRPHLFDHSPSLSFSCVTSRGGRFLRPKHREADCSECFPSPQQTTDRLYTSLGFSPLTNMCKAGHSSKTAGSGGSGSSLLGRMLHLKGQMPSSSNPTADGGE